MRFCVRLAGEELRLTSDHELSRSFFLVNYPLIFDEFQLNGSHVHLLIFDSAPQAFRKNVVQCSPFAIHADLDIGRLQQVKILRTSKMAPLVTVADQRYRLL